MDTNDAINGKLEYMGEIILRIQDDLGSNNQEALTSFAELEGVFSELQEYFDYLDQQ